MLVFMYEPHSDWEFWVLPFKFARLGMGLLPKGEAGESTSSKVGRGTNVMWPAFENCVSICQNKKPTNQMWLNGEKFSIESLSDRLY